LTISNRSRTRGVSAREPLVLSRTIMGVLPKLIRVPATNTNITIVSHDERGYVVQEMFKDTHVVEIA